MPVLAPDEAFKGRVKVVFVWYCVITTKAIKWESLYLFHIAVCQRLHSHVFHLILRRNLRLEVLSVSEMMKFSELLDDSPWVHAADV